MLSFDTGMNDENGHPIWVGDILQSEYGYQVLVCQGDSGYYGSLVCPIEDSCRDIPYSLNGGYGHTIVWARVEEGFTRESFY
jgi:hypothetical protein